MKNREQQNAASAAIRHVLRRLEIQPLTARDVEGIRSDLEIALFATDDMQQKIDMLLRHRFGQKSEKKSKSDLSDDLADGGPGIPDDVAAEYQEVKKQNTGGTASKTSKSPAKEKNPGKPSGRNSSIPDTIPRVEKVCDVPDADKVCGQCFTQKEKIGQDTTEQLNYVPSRLEILRVIYPKYTCTCCKDNKIIVAPRETRPTIGEGLATFGLLAFIIVAKYVDHLPLYRLHRIFKRQGLPLPESTMGKWVSDCAHELAPIAALIGEQVLSSHLLQTDDTGLLVQDKQSKRGSKRGHLWGYLGDGKWFYYRYTPDWRAADTQNFLKNRRGWLMADAYAGYNAVFQAPDSQCIEVGCWSHARRYFERATTQDKRASVGLHYIGKLYEIESRARDQDYDTQMTLQCRQNEAPVILAQFKQWLDDMVGVAVPKSGLGKAISYVSNQWVALQRYLEDGALPIDNTAIERGHRATAVGRNNWLFAGSDAAAERTATLYTIVGTCALNDVNPTDYICDVLRQLQQRGSARRILDLLPPNWAIEQKAKQKTDA